MYDVHASPIRNSLSFWDDVTQRSLALRIESSFLAGEMARRQRVLVLVSGDNIEVPCGACATALRKRTTGDDVSVCVVHVSRSCRSDNGDRGEEQTRKKQEEREREDDESEGKEEPKDWKAVWGTAEEAAVRLERIAAGSDVGSSGERINLESAECVLRRWRRGLLEGESIATTSSTILDVVWCTEDFERDDEDERSSSWPADAVCAYGIFKSTRDCVGERAALHAVVANTGGSSGVVALMSLGHIAGHVHCLDSGLAASRLFQHISFGAVLWRGVLEFQTPVSPSSSSHDDAGNSVRFMGAQLVEERRRSCDDDNGSDAATPCRMKSRRMRRLRERDEQSVTAGSSSLQIIRTVKMSTVDRQLLSKRYKLEFCSASRADAGLAVSYDRIIVGDGAGDANSGFPLLRAALFGGVGIPEKEVGFLAALSGTTTHFIIAAGANGHLHACAILNPSTCARLQSACASVHRSILDAGDAMHREAPPAEAVADATNDINGPSCEDVLRDTLACPLLRRQRAPSGDSVSTDRGDVDTWESYIIQRASRETPCDPSPSSMAPDVMDWQNILQPDHRRRSSVGAKTSKVLDEEPVAGVLGLLARASQKLDQRVGAGASAVDAMIAPMVFLRAADRLRATQWSKSPGNEKENLDVKRARKDPEEEKKKKREARKRRACQIQTLDGDRRRMIGGRERAAHQHHLAHASNGVGSALERKSVSENVTATQTPSSRRQRSGLTSGGCGNMTKKVRTETVRKISYC